MATKKKLSDHPEFDDPAEMTIEEYVDCIIDGDKFVFDDLDKMQNGKIADICYLLYQEYRKQSQIADHIKSLSTRLKNVLKEKLEEDGLTQAAGNVGKMSLKQEATFTLKDKISFYKWAVENGRFEMLRQTLNPAPTKAFYELEGLLPEGVEIGEFTKISLTKR